MSSVWVSSPSQFSAAVANLHPVSSPTSSSAQCASANGSFPRRQPPSDGYGFPGKSGAVPLENKGNFNPISSSGRSGICWSHPGRGAGGVDGSASRDSAGGCDVMSSGQQQLPRRELAAWIALPALISAGSSAFGAPSAAAAAEEDGQILEPPTTDAPAKIGLIEKLLERSKANKAKYDQERLDAYYRRNFKDYFNFLKGGIQDKDKDKLTEAEKGILNWLEKNQ